MGKSTYVPPAPAPPLPDAPEAPPPRLQTSVHVERLSQAPSPAVPGTPQGTPPRTPAQHVPAASRRGEEEAFVGVRTAAGAASVLQTANQQRIHDENVAAAWQEPWEQPVSDGERLQQPASAAANDAPASGANNNNSNRSWLGWLSKKKPVGTPQPQVASGDAAPDSHEAARGSAGAGAGGSAEPHQQPAAVADTLAPQRFRTFDDTDLPASAAEQALQLQAAQERCASNSSGAHGGGGSSGDRAQDGGAKGKVKKESSLPSWVALPWGAKKTTAGEKFFLTSVLA